MRTQYFDRDLLPLGKEEPFVGSHGTYVRNFSTTATGSLCRTPSPLERQTMGGVVVSIQIGKVKSDIYSGEEVRTRL